MADEKKTKEKIGKKNNIESNVSTTANTFGRIFFYAYWI